MAENNMPIISKRLLSMVRVLYIMLRKGILKSKIQADIDLMLKRGKVAGKAIIHSLIFPHLTSSFSSALSHGQRRNVSPPPTDYEFSCSNTPAHHFPVLFNSKRVKHSNFFGCTAPKTREIDEDDTVSTAQAVKMVLEMLNNHNDINIDEKVVMEKMSVQPSPALPGFGRSPATVRQLRVTDSPFPLHDMSGDRLVDEKADKFIANFYRDLHRQRIMASPSPRSW